MSNDSLNDDWQNTVSDFFGTDQYGMFLLPIETIPLKKLEHLAFILRVEIETRGDHNDEV